MQVTLVHKVLLFEFFQKKINFIQDIRQNLKHDLHDWKCPARLTNYAFLLTAISPLLKLLNIQINLFNIAKKINESPLRKEFIT